MSQKMELTKACNQISAQNFDSRNYFSQSHPDDEEPTGDDEEITV